MKFAVITFGRAGSSELIEILTSHIDVIPKPYNHLYPKDLFDRFGKEIKVIFLTRDLNDIIKSLLQKEKECGINWIKKHYKNLKSDYSQYKEICKIDTLNFEKLYYSYLEQKFFDVLFIKYENLYFNCNETLEALQQFTNTNNLNIKFQKNNKWKSKYNSEISKNTNLSWGKSLQEKIDLYKFKFHYFKDFYYIHIGKCGGSSIRNILKNPLEPKFNFFHLKRPDLDYQDDSNRYLFFVRNPIKRFVSAFNHSKNIIDFDISKIKNPIELNLTNCLAPFHIKNKIKNKGIAFSEEYDGLIKFFKDANNLGESLSSENQEIKAKALRLMKNNFEHLYKGIGWYLHNGDFVEKYYSQIVFVGRLEFFEEDINKLSKKEFVKFSINSYDCSEIRKNTKNYSKFLSNTAQQNIRNFYRQTDIRAIKMLCEYNLLPKSYLRLCLQYNNKKQ